MQTECSSPSSQKRSLLRSQKPSTSTLSQITEIHILSSYCFKTNFNIILPQRHRFSKFRFPPHTKKNRTHFSSPPNEFQEYTKRNTKFPSLPNHRFSWRAGTRRNSTVLPLCLKHVTNAEHVRRSWYILYCHSLGYFPLTTKI